MNKSISYQNYLVDSLRDPEEAAGYLNAALKGGDLKMLLIALQNVIQAHRAEPVPRSRPSKKAGFDDMLDRSP